MFKYARRIAVQLLCVASAACVADDLDVSEQTQEIVGGAAIDIAGAPWQVSLQTGGSHFCGGSIVTPTWIVTAAHCLEGGAPTRIVAGATRLSQSATGQIRTVKRVITFPGYADPTAGKDAALVELASPLTLDGTTVRAIRPITSGTAAELTAPGVMATVTGWGATVEGGRTLPDQLQMVQVPIVALTTASAAYNMPLTPDQLPAGFATGGKDSCQGDSGGPLVVMNNQGEPMLAGIVSWGEGCARANKPGLYARLSSFARWMDGYAGGPPLAVAGTDITAQAGAQVQLDASASTDTSFGEIVGYTWRQVSGPPVTLQNADSSVASFTAPATAGSLEFELTVRDDGGATSSDGVVVTVASNGGDGGGGGGGSGNSNGDEDGFDSTVYGGCASHRGGTGSGVLALLVVGLLCGRRRVTR
jgi:secreted trypsin-like serine protease